MKKIFSLFTILLLSTLSFAQALPGDKIAGIWESTNSDVVLKFEIYKSGDEFFGKLLWASDMFNDDGSIKKDFNNPDKSLRNRFRKNIVNITDLRFDDGEYVDGKLYNPADGRTYSLTGKLKNLDELEFRGYIGLSLFGRTIKFKRVQ